MTAAADVLTSCHVAHDLSVNMLVDGIVDIASNRTVALVAVQRFTRWGDASVRDIHSLNPHAVPGTQSGLASAGIGAALAG